MNRSLSHKILFFATYAILAIAVAACSSDDETQLPGKPDMDFVESLDEITEPVTYSLSNVRIFDKPKGFDKWTEQTELLSGYSSAIPGKLLFCNGKMWSELIMFGSAGPSLFYELWHAYTGFTGQNQLRLFIAEDINIDPKSNSISIVSNDYEILKFEKSGFVLAFYSEYLGGKNQNGGQFMDWYYMTPTQTTVDLNSENILSFDTKFDAYDFIIERARERFGDEVDLDELYHVDRHRQPVDLNQLKVYVRNLREKAGK